VIHVHRLPALLLVTALALSLASPARAEDESARVEALERRVEALERDDAGDADGWGRWTDHVSLGGSANVGYYDGYGAHPWRDQDFQVWDARFFVDAESGGPVELFGHTVVRNAGMSFEWNLVRIGNLEPVEVGDLYVELQHLGGSGWASLQVGRFQIPVGEAYLRYGKGYAHKPFISNAVSGAWFWDEGVKLYGGTGDGLFSYIASIMANETLFDRSEGSQKQYTLKLVTEPLDWLRVSASGLYAGSVEATPFVPVSGSALWLGEMWIRPFGAGAVVPGYVDGLPVPPGPLRLGPSWLVGGDVVASWDRGVDLWLSYSYYDSDQGSPTYSRTFHAWIAEVVLHGRLVHDALRDLYLGVRANGLGTYDDRHGYLLDARNPEIGYNMSALTDYSVVLGWKLLRGLTLRTEYTRRVIDLVDGTPAPIRAQAEGMDAWAVELGVAF
jgi:hypothetical protein